MKKTHILMLAT